MLPREKAIANNAALRRSLSTHQPLEMSGDLLELSPYHHLTHRDSRQLKKSFGKPDVQL